MLPVNSRPTRSLTRMGCNLVFASAQTLDLVHNNNALFDGPVTFQTLTSYELISISSYHLRARQFQAKKI